MDRDRLRIEARIRSGPDDSAADLYRVLAATGCAPIPETAVLREFLAPVG